MKKKKKVKKRGPSTSKEGLIKQALKDINQEISNITKERKLIDKRIASEDISIQRAREMQRKMQEKISRLLDKEAKLKEKRSNLTTKEAKLGDRLAKIEKVKSELGGL